MQRVLCILMISQLLGGCVSLLGGCVSWFGFGRNPKIADCSRSDYLGMIWQFALFGNKEPPSTPAVREVLYAIAHADKDEMHSAELGIETVEERDQREFLRLLLRYATQQLDDPETCFIQRDPMQFSSVQTLRLRFEKEGEGMCPTLTLHEAAYIHLEEVLDETGKYSCPGFGRMTDRILP